MTARDSATDYAVRYRGVVCNREWHRAYQGCARCEYVAMELRCDDCPLPTTRDLIVGSDAWCDEERRVLG